MQTNRLAPEEMTPCPTCGELTFEIGPCFRCSSAAPNKADGFPSPASYIAGLSDGIMAPIDILIFCPSCGKQHVDQPEPDICECGHMRHQDHEYGYCRQECPCNEFRIAWDNPPHKSHTCRRDYGGCGLIFRIADVPTNGVQFIKTIGKDDTWHASKQEAANA